MVVVINLVFIVFFVRGKGIKKIIYFFDFFVWVYVFYIWIVYMDVLCVVIFFRYIE